MTHRPTASTIIKNPVHFLAFGFGSGLSPVAPGTMGTVVAVPIYVLLTHYLPLTQYLMAVGLLTLVGIAICHKSAQWLGVHDHPGIVWDEIAGFLITMIAAPEGWWWIFTGFLLFRLFDIWKPWPIGAIDKQVSGGLGIMLDDILAGVYAWGVIQILAAVIYNVAV
jgi:phosphatidylglycerophosphatase A